MQSAIAIIFPGVDIPEIERASALHEVNIILKEHYNPHKNYKALIKPPKRFAASVGQLNLLFVFPDESSVLINTPEGLKKIQRLIDRMSHMVLT